MNRQSETLAPDLNVVRVQRLTLFLDVTREPERSEGAASQQIGRELGTHKRSCPDLKH
ncbi:MAG: hypothetical protein ABSH41_24650 [Syntrophobacteraceae bacterium]